MLCKITKERILKGIDVLYSVNPYKFMEIKSFLDFWKVLQFQKLEKCINESYKKYPIEISKDT